MTHLTTLAAGIAGILLLVQIGWSWRLLQLGRAVARSEEKLGRLADALALLTETSESGFRAVALELERPGLVSARVVAQKRSGRPLATRMSAAAKRGNSVQEIAAAEDVSEGEVRLRLHIAEQARLERAHDRPARKKEH